MSTPTLDAQGALAVMLEAQAFVRVLMTAIDCDDDAYDFVTMLEAILEKLELVACYFADEDAARIRSERVSKKGKE